MSKITDTLLRSYNNSVLVANNADTEKALIRAIEAATSFMYCNDARKADLYARLIEAGFVQQMGIERRISTNMVIKQWNYDHIFNLTEDPAPSEQLEEEDVADKPEFAYPEPTYLEESKKWQVDTTLGELTARDLFDEEPTSGDLIATRDSHELRLLAAQAAAAQAAQQEAQA